jgi:hypothetical protein
MGAHGQYSRSNQVGGRRYGWATSLPTMRECLYETEQRASIVLFARSSRWFRYGLRGFFHFHASPFPSCMPHAVEDSPPYYRDAAARPKRLPCFCTANSPFGLPCNPFPTQAPTSRMNASSMVGTVSWPCLMLLTQRYACALARRGPRRWWIWMPRSGCCRYRVKVIAELN